MSADESRPPIRRGRQVEKKVLPAGPVRDLRDAIYLLYAEADRPQLEVLAQQIAQDDGLPGAPGKDLIGKIISGDGLASQQDTVTVTVALHQAAGHQDIAAFAAQTRRLWVAAASAEPAPAPDLLGHPVGDCDPVVLEVHPAIQVPGTDTMATLPTYIPRTHDVKMRKIIDRMREDTRSRLITLVGGSSTGKTRAGWELARYLESTRPGRWRLWHPFDPTRPYAALVDLQRVGSNTIVWLNEAQHYLMPADAGLGEKVASGLRTLLQDPSRGPVLVLATLWPEYWSILTTRPVVGHADIYGQARELLDLGIAITVTDTFTGAELAAIADPSIDARLRYAAEHAEKGRITQYLAGVPALEDRYHAAPPSVRAVLQVAMDARRLGHPLALPHALLEEAAPGYLDDYDWDTLSENWLEQALDYTGQPCRGARGLLTRIRTRPGDPALPAGQLCYRLADHLDETGRTKRARTDPPDSLWKAFANTLTDPGLLMVMAGQALERGRYHHAIKLYRRAGSNGEIGAMQKLVELREQSGHGADAEALALEAGDRGETSVLRTLARMRERAGDSVGAEAVYRLAADRNDPYVLQALAVLRERAGDPTSAEAWAVMAAERGDVGVFWALTKMRELAGDATGAETLAAQSAVSGNTFVLRELARMRQRVRR